MNPTDSLNDYTVEIEWSKPERPIDYQVIARTEEDAIEIAKRQFRKGYVPECEILSAKIKPQDPLKNKHMWKK